jgi:purine-nucleoside/S-methyl-5'-thioadenosine phosphorylase / adenosine deaminase
MKIESPELTELPGVRHGFFGRQGGVSDGAWSSLNVGLRSGDQPERIEANRALVAAKLGVVPSGLVTARQVHGATAIAVTEPWDNWQAPDADALATNRPGLLLGVLAADCGPVLLADAAAGVIGAAHAGWKGALGGVLEAVVATMTGLGAQPGRITAALGPCIGQASYEVGPDFIDRFASAEPDSDHFFRAAGEKALFDLMGFIVMRLARAGVGRVDSLAYDTCAEEGRFFSYRRAMLRREERFGLQLSAIALDG